MNTRSVFLTVVAGLALAVLGLAFQASAALAAPAAPVDIPITQPDGNTFTARAWGDEWQHGVETADGYTIVLDEASGYWVYAAAVDGALAPALAEDGQPQVVGKAAPRGLEKHARPAPAVRPQRPGLEEPGLDAPALGGPLLAPNAGSQPLLVVFVNFTNRVRTYPLATFEARAWGETGSIYDFYRDASFNQLFITRAADTQVATPAGMVEVSLPYAHPSDTDVSQQIARDALIAADPFVSFNIYDLDSDGYVTGSELHTLFIIAGYEESYCYGSCPTPVIWGHMWWLNTPLSLDGKYLAQSSPLAAGSDYGGYTMFGEIHGLGGADNHAATIGIMAHEMGHDLSWPDLYDTDGSSIGAGEWSIMGSASWNGVTQPGDTPGLPDAWLKWYQGWIVPTPAAAGVDYILNQAATSMDALLLGTNPGGVDWDFIRHSGAGEYWLLENRQKTGWDAALPGCGILIWHIDESVSYWNDANANEDRPLVGLEQADGLDELYWGLSDRGDAGDPYPGTSANRKFSQWGFPQSDYYSGASSDWDVTILSTSCAPSMSVNVKTVSNQALDSSIYLPGVYKMRPLTGRVTYRGASAPGRVVTVRARNYSNVWSTYATAVTDAAGNYFIGRAPDDALYNAYYVRWTNDALQGGLLGAWYCDTIVNSAVDDFNCSFDISEAATTAPAHGAAINLPYTFRWNRRVVPTDNYEIDFTDGQQNWWWWYNLGYVGSWTMYNLPASMYTHMLYYWGIYIYGPNGYGEPLYLYSMSFNERSSPALNDPLDAAGRHEEALRVLVLEEDSDLFSARRGIYRR